MRVWCEIFDPTYSTKLGRIDPIVASFQRKLDEAGVGRATFASEPKSLGLIRALRIVEIWISDSKLVWDEVTEQNQIETYKRKLGAFVLETVDSNPDEHTILVRGPGVMGKLVDSMTLPGLYFENATVATVLSSLAALGGWTVTADAALASQYISVRFAGENILRAMMVVAESQGIHLRQGEDSQEIEAGVFGDIESHAEYVKGDAGEISLHKEAPMMIQGSIDLTEESSDIVNKVYIFGGGDGDAALTMALADRSFVDSEVVNGRSHYFIADSASISLYGLKARRLDVKRINPTQPSDAAEVYAANAIADAGSAWLARNSMPYELLKMRVTNVNETIKPGSKVHIRYKESINLLGVPFQERDIDEPYWVMAIEESVTADGLEVALDVANLDRYQTNAADIVVGMIDAINVQNVNIQPYPAPSYWSTPAAPIDTDVSYLVNFAVNELAVRLNQAVVHIFRRRWTIVGGTAETELSISLPSHRHKVAVWQNSNIPASDGRSRYTVAGNEAASIIYNIYLDYIAGETHGDLWTRDAGGSGTASIPALDLVFDSVITDAIGNLLKNVTLKLDGNVHSTGLFPDGNTDNYASVDITDALKAGTLRGFHELEVLCAEGRGDIYLVIFLDIDVSRVRSS